MNYVSFNEEPLFGKEEITSTTVAGSVSSVPAAALSVLLGVGTGSFLPYDLGRERGTVLANPIVIEHEDVGHREPSDLFMTPAARLTVVRRWFSMSITDLAAAMRVQRPTIYSWMSSRSTPKQANLDRLRDLHRLGKAWRRRTSRPAGESLKELTPEGESLLTLLAARRINEASVLRLIERLTREDKAATKAAGLASAAGFDDKPHDDADSSFDAETLLES